MAAGRPTKYKEEYCEDIVMFFKTYEGFPTFENFAVSHCNCTRETLHEWKRVHPDFSDAYKKAEEVQRYRLMDGAMSGAYNNTFSIFFAKNNMGMKDKVENEHTGLDGININIVGKRDK